MCWMTFIFEFISQQYVLNLFPSVYFSCIGKNKGIQMDIISGSSYFSMFRIIEEDCKVSLIFLGNAPVSRTFISVILFASVMAQFLISPEMLSFDFNDLFISLKVSVTLIFTNSEHYLWLVPQVIGITAYVFTSAPGNIFSHHCLSISSNRKNRWS